MNAEVLVLALALEDITLAPEDIVLAPDDIMLAAEDVVPEPPLRQLEMLLALGRPFRGGLPENRLPAVENGPEEDSALAE